MSTVPIWTPDVDVRSFGQENTYRWATITDTDPLRVRLDGDADGLPITPSSLVDPAEMVPGDRVWVQMYGRRLLVVGKAPETGTHKPRNLAPDPGLEDDLDIPLASTDGSGRATYIDRFSIVMASGTYSATRDGLNARSGGLALKLSSNVSPSFVMVFGPHFDVIPGKTYVGRVWVKKGEAGTSKLYVRLAGGSTDAMTEYPATNGSNGIPIQRTVEGINLSTDYAPITFIATIPAGVTRVAIEAMNYQPAATSTIYLDDFDFRPIELVEDTGWMPLALLNGWVGYGGNYGTSPQLRVRNQVVHIIGLVKNGTTTAGTDIAKLPSGIAPPVTILTTPAVSPGTSFGRVDYLSDGTIEGPGTGNLNATWTPLVPPPWPMGVEIL